MSDADERFRELRDSGWTGPIDQDGNKVEDLDQWINDQLGRGRTTGRHRCR